MPSTFKYNFQK